MAQYTCCYCGRKTSNPSSGSCTYSPHKSHEYINANEKKDYICSYCGRKTSMPTGGSCSKSPHKTHKYI